MRSGTHPGPKEAAPQNPPAPDNAGAGTRIRFGTIALLVVFSVCLLWGHLIARAAAPGKSPASQPYTWRNVVIVGGGFVPGIVFSTKQAGLIYARTDIGGAYRWDESRRSWVPLVDWISQADWNLYGIESIGLDPTDARRVYLAAGTYTQAWAGNGAILRSGDQGRTWQRTNMPFKIGGNDEGRSVGERLAVDPHKDSILYFGSRDDGLWKSADYAVTWKKVSSFPITGPTNGVGIGFVVFAQRSGQPGKPTPTIYVGVTAPGTTLYRSADAGATWQAVPGQPAGLLPHHGVLSSDGMLYLTYGSGPGPNGMTGGAVWKYDTRSGHWTDITPVKPGSAGSFGYAGLTVDAAHPHTIMAATMDKWSSGDDIYRTTDGGAHWTALKASSVRDSAASPFVNFGAAAPSFGWWIGTVEIDPFHPGHVLYGTGATIWGSDDANATAARPATHWTVRAQGLEETAVNDLISPPAGAHLLSALGDIGGFRHDDLTVSPRGGMYQNPMIGNTDSLDFAEKNPAVMARVGRGQPGKSGAYSLDGGATWQPFDAEPEGSRGSGSIAVTADGGAFVWTPSRDTPSYSRDHGTTWTGSHGAPPGLRIVADRVNPRQCYGFDSSSGTVYVSTDGGATFTARAHGLPPGSGRLRAVPGVTGNLWLTTGSALYHSTDSGVSFVKSNTVQEARAAGFGKAAPGRSYPAIYLIGQISGQPGIFRSDDTGVTWVRINDDQHQYGTADVIIGDPRVYGRVYVGTNGRGILYADPVPAITK